MTTVVAANDVAAAERRAERIRDLRSVLAYGPCVYILRDVAGCDLYVGSTNDIIRRLGEHSRTKSWWRDVSTVEQLGYDTRERALEVERAMIRTLNPEHNAQCADVFHRAINRVTGDILRGLERAK